MSIYINKCDLYNELGKISAPMEANDFKANIYMCINQEDGIDAVDIVLCRNCQNRKEMDFNNEDLYCKLFNRAVDGTDFCVWGVRE